MAVFFLPHSCLYNPSLPASVVDRFVEIRRRTMVLVLGLTAFVQRICISHIQQKRLNSFNFSILPFRIFASSPFSLFPQFVASPKIFEAASLFVGQLLLTFRLT